eukprot:1106351-Alexandrium_andersonii.AAC.1
MPSLADEALHGGLVEVVPGPAQFKPRTPKAVLHVRQFKLRSLAIWSQCWQMCLIAVSYTHLTLPTICSV